MGRQRRKAIVGKIQVLQPGKSPYAGGNRPDKKLADMSREERFPRKAEEAGKEPVREFLERSRTERAKS